MIYFRLFLKCDFVDLVFQNLKVYIFGFSGTLVQFKNRLQTFYRKDAILQQLIKVDRCELRAIIQ